MSLLRLLTAGKCLVGLGKSGGRYQLPADKALPFFGAKRNPFRATAVPEKTESESEKPPAVEGEPNSCPGTAVEPEANRDGNRMKDCGPVPAGAPPSPAKAENSAPVKASAVRMFLLWGRAKRARSSGGAAGRPLVQGELSLDTVKVVRNDLSESDLEVVRVEPALQADKAKPANPDEQAPATPDAGWGAVTGRFFGLGKT